MRKKITHAYIRPRMSKFSQRGKTLRKRRRRWGTKRRARVRQNGRDMDEFMGYRKRGIGEGLLEYFGRFGSG